MESLLTIQWFKTAKKNRIARSNGASEFQQPITTWKNLEKHANPIFM